MIKHLGRTHAIVVASLANSEQELKEGAALKEYCEDVVAEVLPNSVRWVEAFKKLPTSASSSVAYFWSPRLYERIRELLVQSTFDVIFVHCAFVAQYVADWHRCFRILDFGDLDSAKWAEYARWKAPPMSFGYALESRKLRDYERRIARSFHQCTVTTRGEMEEFQKLEVPVPCTVIPNGVDTSYFRFNRTPAPLRRAVVFLGRMDYFPNIDGACYFVRSILPLIRQRIPDVEFWIVGSNPTRKVRELAKIPGVRVTGYVPDVRPYVKDAAVSVVPLRIARGTQNKILECLAMGIPTVASSQAAQGIQPGPGEPMLVADTSITFAKQVVDVLESSTLGDRLAASGRAHIERTHRWATSMRILDDVVASHARSSYDNVPVN
jgi:sugar transferase (PEP-CTERM/EpsH1 system associated)